MQILKALSLLLDYPTSLLQAMQTELGEIIDTANIDRNSARQLKQFIAHRCQGDLLDWQADYDSLFERGRSLSLLLFEHVHGESRDRGQAMVDLMNQYQSAGLSIGKKELPDYIPLYLEFLSTQGEDNARLGLQEIAHILALLACRLQERQSDYAAVFEALLQLSSADIDLGDMRKKLAGEQRDDTPDALDKVWQEEAITFGAGDAMQDCNGNYRPTSKQSREQEQTLNFSTTDKPKE